MHLNEVVNFMRSKYTMYGSRFMSLSPYELQNRFNEINALKYDRYFLSLFSHPLGSMFGTLKNLNN